MQAISHLELPENDDDLRGSEGRFGKHPRGGDDSTINDASALSGVGEDAIKEFLQPELSKYFHNTSDAALFVKVMNADGLVPYLR